MSADVIFYDPEDFEEPEDAPLGGEADAEWVLARLARIAESRRNVDAQFERMVDRYANWHTTATEALDMRENRERALLRGWMEARAAADPKAAKTVRLPSGTIAMRKGTTTVEVDDADAFIAWAESNGHSDLVRRPEPKIPPPAPDKTAIKASFHQRDGFYVVLGGEIVPGVHPEVHEPSLIVTLDQEQ
jgi:phage host-nuclease inhibitor protein Gam